jgi:hypothetical protein
MKISYAITVCNEVKEIKKLISILLESKREDDEVVVLFDKQNGTAEVWSYLQDQDVVCEAKSFKNHFADWKNYLTGMCSGDYIFQIDADEFPNKILIDNLPAILEANPTVDMLRVSRINTVEGLTEEHIKKWGWTVNEKGWVNWADWQMRIYRRHPDIKWKNKVHEVLDGFKIHGMLPMEEEYALYHPKDIKRQEKQNAYYDTL